MMKRLHHILRLPLNGMIRISLACMLLCGIGATANADNHEGFDGITIFMHGVTKHAWFDGEGGANGPVPTLVACATKNMDVSFRYAHAPLSRANAIINTFDKAIWFPSGMSVPEDRKKRLVGPVGNVDILWYQRADNMLDPAAESFMTEARVTAYTGSRFEERLKNEGYNFVTGSADHQRLVYMLMSDQVDALLAVDFRAALPEETRRVLETRMKTTTADRIPLGMEASVKLHDSQPDLIRTLQANVTACKKG